MKYYTKADLLTTQRPADYAQFPSQFVASVATGVDPYGCEGVGATAEAAKTDWHEQYWGNVRAAQQQSFAHMGW